VEGAATAANSATEIDSMSTLQDKLPGKIVATEIRASLRLECDVASTALSRSTFGSAVATALVLNPAEIHVSLVEGARCLASLRQRVYEVSCAVQASEERTARLLETFEELRQPGSLAFAALQEALLEDGISLTGIEVAALRVYSFYEVALEGQQDLFYFMLGAASSAGLGLCVLCFVLLILPKLRQAKRKKSSLALPEASPSSFRHTSVEDIDLHVLSENDASPDLKTSSDVPSLVSRSKTGRDSNTSILVAHL